MKVQRLSDLERFELLQLMYPEKLSDDSDIGDEEDLLDEIGVDYDVFDDLMGRVVMLTMPMKSPISGKVSHCLGDVAISDGNCHMIAAVKREVDI